MAADEVEREARDLLAQLTPQERLHCVSGDERVLPGTLAMARRYNGHPYVAGAVPRLGIEGIRFCDGPRGVVLGSSTAFPAPIARGASFDPELEARVGDAIGVEARAQGANLVAAVCVNLLRHPAWGRAQETYGEDSHHVGELGAAQVRGLQRHVMACVKHFAANSVENSRFWLDVRVDEADLRDIYLPHFRRCVEAGAASVMAAYNRINGEFCAEHEWLLTDLLKGEWGFDGFVMSDFLLGVRDGPRALEAGLDLEMPFDWRMRGLRERPPDPRRLDDAVLRLLRQQRRFARIGEHGRYGAGAVGCDAHRELAREAARRSFVLLRNEGLLPFGPQVRSIAVCGRLAAAENTGDRGSSWVRSPHIVSVLGGLAAAGARHGVHVHDAGTGPGAAAAARGSDAAVVVAGCSHRDEGEFLGPLVGGDRRRLALRAGDAQLIEQVCATNPRTVVLLYGSGPFVPGPWCERAGALMAIWYPGAEGGTAVGEVLFGEHEPGGRLPVGWAASPRQLPPFRRFTRRIEYGPLHGYRRLEALGRDARFPFGFGLGYTTMELGPAAVVERDDDLLVLEVPVRNAGERRGGTVVQAYVNEALGSHPAPLRTLRAFRRVELEPGEEVSVRLEVPAADEVYVGSSSAARDLARVAQQETRTARG